MRPARSGNAKANAARPPRITAPAPGTIIALDPDIPPRHQRVRFSADGAQVRWRLDGKPLANGPQTQWLPWPGRHTLQLADAQRPRGGRGGDRGAGGGGEEQSKVRSRPCEIHPAAAGDALKPTRC